MLDEVLWYNVVMKITDRLAYEADGGEDRPRFVKEERVDEETDGDK